MNRKRRVKMSRKNKIIEIVTEHTSEEWAQNEIIAHINNQAEQIDSMQKAMKRKNHNIKGLYRKKY
jgi:hypothetical protein